MEIPDSSSRECLLIEVLTVLAAGAEPQVAWLIKHGVATNELALDSERAYRMAEGLVAHGASPPKPWPTCGRSA